MKVTPHPSKVDDFAYTSFLTYCSRVCGFGVDSILSKYFERRFRYFLFYCKYKLFHQLVWIFFFG